MKTYYIYRLTNSLRFDKCGATCDLDKRSRDNRQFHGEQCVITILETIEGPNTPEFWQVVGDREWEYAEQYGYPKGDHYRSAREKRPLMNKDTAQKANITRRRNGTQGNGGKIGAYITNRIRRKITFEEAQEIRLKAKPRVYTYKMLAEEYNTTTGSIKAILQGLSYKQP